MNKTKELLIGLDPGETYSGVCVVSEFGIVKAINISNDLLIDFISEYFSYGDKLLVIIEDMRPYNMRINDNVINTIKFIGQIEWRLSDLHVAYALHPRWEIKQWVFNNYPAMCGEEVTKKIDYAARREASKKGVEDSGKRRSPSFVYVDDRIVEKAVKLWWGITKPKVGQKSPYGLSTHSWQGLAMATFYIASKEPSFLRTGGTS